jgi:voltage-gated potassium channel
MKPNVNLLKILETIIVIIFTVEYLLRIIAANSKLKFIFSFYGLVDLIAILPFYISTGIDLRSVRIFRMLRLFRILKIVKYTKAIDRYKAAFKEIRAELSLFFMVTVIMLYVTGVGFYYFKNKAQPELIQSVFDGLWWAIITLTTVGYGDVYPITLGGKVFTFIILMIGLGIVAVPAGLLASALSNDKSG